MNREEDIEELKKEMLDIYDPITDNSKAIILSKERGPSKNFLEWFLKLEALIKKR